MAFFDIFAWIVLLLLVAIGVGVIALLGLWPGKVAHARNHPQAEAIAIGSWLTLFLGFVLWPVVAIWAYTKPVQGGVASGKDFNKKIDALAERLARLEADSRASDGENRQ
jgi:membrane protein implicated in regulation of membrane protease activity